MQIAELHFSSPPVYDPMTIMDRVEGLIGSGIRLAGPAGQRETLLFQHAKFPVEYADGVIPAQTAIMPTDRKSDSTDYVDAIQQSWACQDAEERISVCEDCFLLTEMMARGLDPLQRLDLFHGVLQATVEITQPNAIVFMHSQQVVSGEDYLNSCDVVPIQRLGSLNVRYFRISNSDTDDMIMDTRGMTEIGLHDLQCHFRELDPNKVSAVLYNTAVYIAENGPVIEAGHTVTGTPPEAQWFCQFEDAIIEPERELLDLNPGAPFAAGNR